MNARIVMFLISFAVMVSGLVSANMFIIMMVGEINRKRPEGDLISYFGYTVFKIVRIFEEYRRLYPNGKLHIFALLAFGMAVVGVISGAVFLGIIG
jgi:hypothetical protein